MGNECVSYREKPLGAVSRFINKYSELQWNVVKRIMKYLKGSNNNLKTLFRILLVSSNTDIGNYVDNSMQVYMC